MPLSKAKKLRYAEAVKAMLLCQGPLKVQRIMADTGLGWETLSEIFVSLGATVSEVTQVVRLPCHRPPVVRQINPAVRYGPLRSGDWNGIGGIHRLIGGNYGHQVPSPDGKAMP